MVKCWLTKCKTIKCKTNFINFDNLWEELCQQCVLDSRQHIMTNKSTSLCTAEKIAQSVHLAAGYYESSL